MPAGMRVWDAGAALSLDYTNDLFKFLGIVSIGNSHTGTAGSGSITDARLTLYPPCEPFLQIVGASYPNTYYPTITFNGPTILWSYPRSGPGTFSRPNITFVYGLF